MRDAETLQPISDTDVSVHYLNKMDLLFPPKYTSAATDPAGRARLRIRDYASGLHVAAHAKGYISNLHGTIQYSDIFGDNPGRNRIEGELQHFAFDLYSEPAPTLVVVIPDGFRGPFKIREADDEHRIDRTDGKREFEYKLPPNGIIRVKERVLSSYRTRIVAREQSALSPMKWPVQGFDDEVGVRRIDGFSTPDSSETLYVIGDRKIAESVKAQIYEPVEENSFSLDLERFKALQVGYQASE